MRDQIDAADLMYQLPSGELARTDYLVAACSCGVVDPGPDPTWQPDEIPPDGESEPPRAPSGRS